MGERDDRPFHETASGTFELEESIVRFSANARNGFTATDYKIFLKDGDSQTEVKQDKITWSGSNVFKIPEIGDDLPRHPNGTYYGPTTKIRVDIRWNNTQWEEGPEVETGCDGNETHFYIPDLEGKDVVRGKTRYLVTGYVRWQNRYEHEERQDDEKVLLSVIDDPNDPLSKFDVLMTAPVNNADTSWGWYRESNLAVRADPFRRIREVWNGRNNSLKYPYSHFMSYVLVDPPNDNPYFRHDYIQWHDIGKAGQ